MNYDLYKELKKCREKNGFFFDKTKSKFPCAGFIDGILFLNGDEDSSHDLTWEDDEVPTLSFRCLSRTMAGVDEPNYNYINYLIEEAQRLEILDRTDDVRKVQRECPGYGFTKLAWGWHKPASVLVRFFETRYLFGIDDNQYFGVELSSCPQTVDEAYEDLIPNYIRNVKSVRQGEWFFVKTEEPSYYGNAVKSGSRETVLKGRNDKPTSNPHKITCKEWWTVKDSLRINDGKPLNLFKNPYITHPEHNSLELKGWYFAIENTALASYSEMGVD